MHLRPRIIPGERYTSIVVGLIISKDDELLQLVLEEFLESALELYYTRYAKVREIASAVRRVDYSVLASMLVTAYENLKDKYPERYEDIAEGNAEVCVELRLENTENPSEVGEEDILYTIHWHSSKVDDIVRVTPVGYQLFHSFFKNKTGGMVSRLVFDGRVLDSDLEGSNEFYIDKCLPHLGPYFDYLETYFLTASKNDYNVDVSEIKETLKQTLVSYFERRLNNRSDRKRQVFFLDTYLVGDSPASMLIKFNLVMRTDETFTPEYGYDHPKHKFRIIEENNILSSFSSTRTTPVSDPGIDISVTAHPLEHVDTD